MRRRLFVLLLACAACALTLPTLKPAASAPVDESERRKPFTLELPDISSGPITAPETAIPSPELHSLRLRVANPYAEAINYGKIFTKINGESAGTIQNIRASTAGHIITLDLDSKPRFRLLPGKNVVEISATDREGRAYYASYVLIAGRRPVGESAAASATIEALPVAAGADRQPPTILLQQPTGALRLTGDAGTFKVAGLVSDDSGAVASVTINGQAATLTPAPANTRGLMVELSQQQTNAPAAQASPTAQLNAAAAAASFAFAGTANVTAQMTALVVEAKDKAGNAARLSLPVRRREAAVSAQFKGRKFALIVGVSRYKYHEGGLGDLGFPDADARSVRDFLVSPQGGKFAPTDITFLENEQATVEGVRAALNRFLPRAGAGDLIFIFLAGHGAPDPYAPQNLYFLLHDTKVADMPNTALPMTELQEVLDHQVRAERVVTFVDTCHSAGLSGAKIVTRGGLENNLINLYASRLFTETGRAVLTSSDVNELSQESVRWGGGHGIFSWALLEGLRGEADGNSDHFITAGELFNYVRDRVRVETYFRQNPRALPGLNTDLTLAFIPPK
jgi:hypothetical protein